MWLRNNGFLRLSVVRHSARHLAVVQSPGKAVARCLDAAPSDRLAVLRPPQVDSATVEPAQSRRHMGRR